MKILYFGKCMMCMLLIFSLWGVSAQIAPISDISIPGLQEALNVRTELQFERYVKESIGMPVSWSGFVGNVNRFETVYHGAPGLENMDVDGISLVYSRADNGAGYLPLIIEFPIGTEFAYQLSVGDKIVFSGSVLEITKGYLAYFEISAIRIRLDVRTITHKGITYVKDGSNILEKSIRQVTE